MKPVLLFFAVLVSVTFYSCNKRGCTSTDAYNYDPNATENDHSCIPKVFGCRDTASLNYNPNANTDTGSCIPKVYGCTNSCAVNYNSAANTDDGSCICNRDIFFGTYNVHSICAGFDYPHSPDTTNYIWVIYADSSNACKVKISNYLNYNNDIRSLSVCGNHILIPTDTYQESQIESYSGGTITLSGDTLIIYTYWNDPVLGVLLDHCNMIGIKQ